MESDKRNGRDEHLDETTLTRLADGSLRRRAAARARAHLRSCAACRREVQVLRAISAAIRAIPAPRPPEGLFDEIFPEPPEAAASVPVPVPSGRVAAFPRHVVLVAAAGLAVVVAVVALLTVRPDRLMAGASTLRFAWETPETLALEYQTSSALAAEPSLRARMRYWVPDPNRFAQNEPGFSIVELSREEPGLFSGTVGVPPGTAYAVAAIEDMDGDHIDTDFGRFWEYLDTDAEGRPTLQARRYQFLATSELSRPRAAEVARAGAAQFPTQPEFWVWQMVFAGEAVPPQSQDAVVREHAERFAVLDHAAREGQPGPIELDALQRFAALLGEPDLASYWSDQLVRRYPRHGAAALALQQSIAQSSETDRRTLEALEVLWDTTGAPTIAQVGLRLSIGIADPVLTGKWLERHGRSSVFRDLSYDAEIARDMMVVPSLRSVAEAWIVGRLTDSRDELGGERRLDQSRRNFRAETGQRRALLNLYLADLYLDRGEAEEALDAAEWSVEQTWSPEVFVRAAEIHRAAGSDLRATELLALSLVDPVASTGSSPSADTSGLLTGPSEAQLAAARRTMYERLTPSLLDEHVSLNAGLRSVTDEETELHAVVGGRFGLVVQALRPDFVHDDALALLDANSEALRAAGVRTLLIAQRPSPAGPERAGHDRRFLRDFRYEAWDSLRAWRELQYFVLDPRGRLRYRGEDLETALRISFVLSTREVASPKTETNGKEAET